MNVVLRNARIIEKNNIWHDQVVDVEITDGHITKIGAAIENRNQFEELSLENLHISSGWFDTSVSLGEPGFEERETIQNGLKTAALAGFTGIALQPNSFPVLDNQAQIHFVKQKAVGTAVDLYPIGALTKNSQGTDLAELLDMKNAGAVAFGDYGKNIESANLLKIALQYAQDFEGKVIAFSQDQSLKGKGIVNEGITATKLGLKGIPALAEELIIARNLFLLEYTGGTLHIPTVSSKKSVGLIQEAKAKGLKVTCSVSVHHLVLNDAVLEHFDANYSVSPPLRTEDDRLALLEGVLNNTIDCITTDHNPIDIEHKKLEFDLAKTGTIGLESAFGALQTVLPISVIVDKLTAGRSVFGIENVTIAEGKLANLTLFNPKGDWIFSLSDILSKSKNSAFLGAPMKGKVYGICNQNNLILK